MNEKPPKLAEIPHGVVCLADYERIAEQRLDANAWAYFAGGAGDEITMRWNKEAFERTALLARVMKVHAGVSTRVELLGRQFEHPILIAPLAHQRLAHDDGERATAMAAAAQDAGLVVSTLANTSLEDVAASAGPRRWFQLYFQTEREHTQDLVRRAEASGYEAIVVTVDAPVNGPRNREQRVGFKLPTGKGPANLMGYSAKPPAAGTRPIDFLMGKAPTWADIDWLVASTRLPVLIKGIITTDDGVLAIEHGAAGIVVSNHGGRTLDTLPATFDMLPEIVDGIAGRVPVLVDGGIRRGTDVLKCVASGAAAVLVGRPIIYGLAVAGALGVSHVLRILRDELELAMALAGCKSPSDADRSLLRRF